MISKKLALFLAPLLCLPILAACGVQPEGEMCTLEQAYKNGWLTREDVIDIAYFSNDGNALNEETIGEDYAPAQQAGTLSGSVEQQIKLNYSLLQNGDTDGAENVVIDDFFGKYGDCYAVQLGEKDGGSFPVYSEYAVAGINFRSGDTGDVIYVWKAA